MTTNQTPPRPEKVSKVAAATGQCSRRTAETWIEMGYVTFDGLRITNPAQRIDPGSKVLFELPKELQKPKYTVLYHKPLGVLSCGPEEKGYPIAARLLNVGNYVERSLPGSKRGHQYDQAVSLIDSQVKLQCAGRLDLHSKGLLLLTNDVEVIRALLAAEPSPPKEYLVRTSQAITPELQEHLNSLTHIGDEAIKPYGLELLSTDFVKITLYEGKKHQIRRMMREVGLEAIKIKRTMIGPFQLRDLKVGHWCLAKPQEIDALLNR